MEELGERAEMERSEESHHEVQDVETEFVQSEEEEACACERPKEILLEKTSEVTIEDVDTEFVGSREVVEASDDSTHCRELPNMGTVIDIFVADPTSEEVTAPLLEHRPSICNCCGLLDVFKRSQR